MNIILVICYLFAAIGANLVVNEFGPAALPFTAFCLIPFDLTARDFLHERWTRHRKRKMTALVLGGAVLTLLVNISAWKIALASSCAFAVSNAVDYIVYASLHGRHRLLKMNVSNFASSVTDSLIFPIVAFGAISASIAISQAGSKFLGGILWSALIHLVLKTIARRGNGKRKEDSASR